MKKFNLRKTVLGISIVIGSLATANAQWSVQDVNSNAFKTTLEDILDGVKTQISNQEAQKSAMEVLSKQQSVQMEEQDKRNRSNAAMADTIKRDRDAMPLLKQCIDMTRGKAVGGGGGKAARGGAGTDAINAGATTKDMNKITSDTRRLGVAIENLKAASACGTTEMEKSSKFCGSSAEASKYNAANISPRILMGNYKGNEDRSYINYTLDEEAQKAAYEYIRAAAVTYMPPAIDKDKVKYNEAYLAAYFRVANGINTATEAMKAVANNYYAISKPTQANTIFSQYWLKMADVFDKMEMTKPEVPSLTEMYMLEVNQDYYMLKEEQDSDGSEIEQLKNLNRKIALSNYLTARQINLQEYQTILLSHLVAREYAEDSERLTTEANNIDSK